MFRQPKIFLSHCHKDRHFATQLQSVLITNDAETYLDQDQIRAGEILPKQIENGINWCDTFLLIWSTNAAISYWVGIEWNMAYDLKKKIIPYCLDNAPLPPVLQNLVRVVAKDDREVGDAKLLAAIFGKDFKPDPTNLFPGIWGAKMDAFGIVQSTYNLELRANGQLEGNGSIDQTGLAGQLAADLGVTEVLNIKVSVNGIWSFDRNTQTLTLELNTSGFGQNTHDVVKIQTTGHENVAIKGLDFEGRTWILQRSDIQFARKDYLKLAEVGLEDWVEEQKSSNSGSLSAVSLFILSTVAQMIFKGDVVKEGIPNITYSVNIEGDEHRAIRLSDYKNRKGQLCCDLKSERWLDNKWIQDKATYIMQEGKWKPIDNIPK